jgi:hypothetical protein
MKHVKIEGRLLGKSRVRAKLPVNHGWWSDHDYSTQAVAMGRQADNVKTGHDPHSPVVNHILR